MRDMEADTLVVPVAPTTPPLDRASPIKPGKSRQPIAPRPGKPSWRGRWIFPCLILIALGLLGYGYFPEQEVLPVTQKIALEAEKVVEAGKVVEVRKEVEPKMVSPLARSGQAWRTGELVEAITIAKQLSAEAGGPLAAARLRHYKRVIEDYETLSALSPGPEYTRQMTTFYLGINPTDDQFFWQKLERDYGRIVAPQFADLARQFLTDLQQQYPDLVLTDGKNKLE